MTSNIQQNATAAAEMTSTSEELSGRAQQFQKIVGFFKIHAPAASARPKLEAAQRVAPAVESGGAAERLLTNQPH